MWFFSFVLGVATSITLLVYGWSTYLDHAKAAAAEARQREWLATMPMPRPRPDVPEPKRRAEADLPEVVRVPVPAQTSWSSSRSSRYSRARHTGRSYANPRRSQGRETW